MSGQPASHSSSDEENPKRTRQHHNRENTCTHLQLLDIKGCFFPWCYELFTLTSLPPSADEQRTAPALAVPPRSRQALDKQKAGRDGWKLLLEKATRDRSAGRGGQPSLETLPSCKFNEEQITQVQKDAFMKLCPCFRAMASVLREEHDIF